MPHFTDLTGLTSVASATAASLMLLPAIARLGKLHLALMLAAIFVLMLFQFAEMPLAAYVRGITGDLSITTMVLLWCAVLRTWLASAAIETRHRYAMMALIALASLALYPMALGIGMYDPYRLGYGSPYFVSVLLLLALAAWIMKYPVIALCISLALLAWTVGWYESGNLWDYLIDPFVSVYALSALTVRGLQKLW
jgi:hypothetical protein